MSQPVEQGLIWITEAMVKYKRSRNWFNARIKRGELRTVPQLGTTKVFLREEEIEQALRQDDKEGK